LMFFMFIVFSRRLAATAEPFVAGATHPVSPVILSEKNDRIYGIDRMVGLTNYC
jgi:hypothetical protein